MTQQSCSDASEICWCRTFQWPRDRRFPAARLSSVQDLSVGLAVQPCSVSSGDGSELPLQRGLQRGKR